MTVRSRRASGGSGLAVAAVAAAAILALLVLVYRDLLAPTQAAPTIIGVVMAALGAVMVLGRRSGAAPTSSVEVSSRLLHVESRLSALDRVPAGEIQDLTEISADVGLLSGLVKSLAEAMTAQDREIEDLKAKVERLSASRPEGSVQAGPNHEISAADRPAPIVAPSPASHASAASDRPFADRTPRGPYQLDPAPAQTAASNRVIPSLLPVAEDAAMAPVRSRLEVDSAAAEAKRAAIIGALDRERIELHLQPVVSLPQRRTRLYEVLARLRLADDTLLSPAEFMPTLERLGQLSRMDEMVVIRALGIATQVAARDSDVRITCNLAPASLRDAGLLAKLETILAAPKTLASRLVFEIPLRSWRTLLPNTVASLERLRGLGVSFALDHVTDLNLDGIALGERGVTLVKIPAELLLAASRSSDPDDFVIDLPARLARQGVQVVAERIERDEDVPELIDLDVALAQGHALGAPRPVRADVAPTRAAPARAAVPAPVAPPASSGPTPPAAGDDRQPFRAFLRRTG